MVARRNPVVPRRTVRVAGCPVQTTVTARPAIVRRWVYTTLFMQRRSLYSEAGLTVGLGVQWTPVRRKLPGGGEPRPGTLQICAGNRCLVFQISQAARVPQILRRFLADARVTFAAFDVASDRRKLRAHHGLEVGSALEIRRIFPGMGNTSMANMADKLLGIRHGVEKSTEVAMSRWDGLKLSRQQERYAAVDAYVSCRLGDFIRRLRDYFRHRAAESEAEYSDDDVESTASEASSGQEYGYGNYWDRCVGFIERAVPDEDQHYGEEAAVDDRLYDSVCSLAY